MSECTDPRLGDRLYAWELGMLNGDEQSELEEHLMECSACFEKAQSFAPAAALLRHSDQLKQRMAGEFPADRDSRTSGWANVVRVSVAAAAVLAVLLLKPWQLEFRPSMEALAADNRLAVVGFQNLGGLNDSAHWSNIVTELLITDLSESRYLQVVSSQRVNDIARAMETEAAALINPETASSIALEAAARFYLTGAVIETSGHLGLTSQLVDVTSGVVLASQSVEGGPGETIFDLVDRLSVQIRSALSLPERAAAEVDRPVAEVTTSSTEAYRHYLDGLESLEKMYRAEAYESFEKAVAADSGFAMAYYHLARLGRRDLMARAVELSPHASRKEQLYIRAAQADIEGDWDKQSAQLRQLLAGYPDEKEAWLRLGSYHSLFLRNDSAIKYFGEAIRLDPYYRAAYNGLTYAYSYAGDLARALETIDRYISLAPGEANPWDTRGDLLANLGYPDRAAESFAKALEIKPDFTPSLYKLIQMRIYEQDYDEATVLLDQLERSDDFNQRVIARLYRVYIPLRQGRLQQALKTTDEVIALNRREAEGTDLQWERTAYHVMKAQVFGEQGHFASALSQIDTCQNIFKRLYAGDSISFRYRQAEYLAGQHKFEQADEQYQVLSRYTEATGRAPCYAFWAGGAIELDRGNPTEAIRHLERAQAITRVETEFYGHYLLARAYLDAGHLSQAVSLLEHLQRVHSPGRLGETVAGVKVHYYLGRAYEESRWPEKAMTQYETFLEIWKNADPGLEAVSDARQRLAKLKSSS